MRTSSRPTLLKRVALVTGTLLLFPTSIALADEDVDVEGVCYVDPTNEVCTDTEVLDSGGDADEEAATDVEAEDQAVATPAAASTDPALADTGADIAVLIVLAALLLGGGLMTIVSSRRRTDASTSS